VNYFDVLNIKNVLKMNSERYFLVGFSIAWSLIRAPKFKVRLSSFLRLYINSFCLSSMSLPMIELGMWWATLGMDPPKVLMWR